MKALLRPGYGRGLWSLFDDLRPGPTTPLLSWRTVAGTPQNRSVLSEGVLGPKRADALEVEGRKGEPEQDGHLHPSEDPEEPEGYNKPIITLTRHNPDDDPAMPWPSASSTA